MGHTVLVSFKLNLPSRHVIFNTIAGAMVRHAQVHRSGEKVVRVFNGFGRGKQHFRSVEHVSDSRGGATSGQNIHAAGGGIVRVVGQTNDPFVLQDKQTICSCCWPKTNDLFVLLDKNKRLVRVVGQKQTSRSCCSTQAILKQAIRSC
jgi:hypothetical protein